MGRHRSPGGGFHMRRREVFSVGQMSSQEDATVNYRQRVNTYTDRAQMWMWGYHALSRLTANVVDHRIERSIYLRDLGRLGAALQARDSELVNQLYRDHLGSSPRRGTELSS